MKINFSPPDIGELEIQEVVDTLRSGWITTGPKTKKLENNISNYIGTNKTVCLNSATAALEMTLRLLGIGKGDEVITSAYTYTATAAVINHVGAKIVLIDTKDGFEMDYDKLEDAITEKTKAVIPVDIAGIPCDYDKIFEVVNNKKYLFRAKNELQRNNNRVIVIADAAHSFGAKYKDNISGNIADFSCFSFHAVKNLTTAEGGAVTWKKFRNIDDEIIYNELMLLSLHGQNKDALAKSKGGSWEYDIIYPGYKCNMTDIMASIGLVQLQRYDDLLKRRKEIIKMYDEGFKDTNIIPIQHYTYDVESSGHLYIVNLKNKSQEDRNNIIKLMGEKGIATNVHYKPLPLMTAYKKLGFDINDYPNAFDKYQNVLTLPLHTLLTDEEVNYIIKTLKELI